MTEQADTSEWSPTSCHDHPDPFAYLAPEFRETLAQWMRDIRSGTTETGATP